MVPFGPTVDPGRQTTDLANVRDTMKVCIVGAPGKLGKYMMKHALDWNYEVVGVCGEKSIEKLDVFKGRITVIPGATNDREVITKAVTECDGAFTVLDCASCAGAASKRVR